MSNRLEDKMEAVEALTKSCLAVGELSEILLEREAGVSGDVWALSSITKNLGLISHALTASIDRDLARMEDPIMSEPEGEAEDDLPEKCDDCTIGIFDQGGGEMLQSELSRCYFINEEIEFSFCPYCGHKHDLEEIFKKS